MAASSRAGATGVAAPPVGDLPSGFHIRLDPRARLWGDGSILIGGAPWRISRLRAPARDLVRRLHEAGRAGLPLHTDPDLRSGRALIDRGFAAPVLPAQPSSRPCTIVIPVLDSAEDLDRLLTSLGEQDVIVVDDGSKDPDAIVRVAQRHHVRLVRHEVNAGPAAARNSGLAEASIDVVAFIDSDCVADPSWPASLLRHFDDPRVAMVAPRVMPRSTSDSLIERYETTRSSLDMGTRAEVVRKGARLGFVPSAALVVRASVLRGSAFDPDLRVGEDVDLAWRLADSGWLVRFDPSVTVTHRTRAHPRSWLIRRFEYGTSASALEDRHPGSLAPARVSGWNVMTLACIGAGHSGIGAGVAGAAAFALWRQIRDLPSAPALAGRIVAQGLLADALGIGHALRREWWPLGALALATTPRSRWSRMAAACMLAPLAWEWATTHPPVDPTRYVAMRLLDDAAYGTGVLASCARNRSLAPLSPQVKLPYWR